MDRFIAITAALAILWGVLTSQQIFAIETTAMPSPKKPGSKAGLKVYVSPDKTVFWPLDLPFYVKLSPNPEDGHESFLLQQVESTDVAAKPDVIAEGVKLDIPGAQFIRWMNHLSNGEVMFKFVADGEPPLTSLKFVQAPRYKSDKAIFYGKGLIAELISSDEHSGVYEAHYKVNDSPLKVYRNPLAINQERQYSIYHRAVDNVGYNSETLKESFIVDLTPPTTQVSIHENFQDKTLSQSSVIKLKADDNLSGVKHIKFRFNDDPSYATYDPNIGIKINSLKDGSQILSYFSSDQVENHEHPQELYFELDKSPPKVAYTFSGDYFISASDQYISPRTKIKLDASDNYVAVDKILFAINQSEEQIYKHPFSPETDQGPLEMVYSAIDTLKNTSKQFKTKFIMDKTPPASTHEFKGTHYIGDNGTVYLAKDSKIEIISKDDLSGLANVQYQLNEQGPRSYQNMINLPGEGRFLFRYWATDHVNNQESYSPILLISDHNPPQILSSFSQEPLGFQKYGNQEVSVYKLGVQLSISARDRFAGVKSLRYRFGEEQWNDYKEKLVFNKSGKFSLSIETVDRVGNIDLQTLKFEVADSQWKSIAH